MLRIPRPRVEEIRRTAAGRASPGDEAVVGVGPGLLPLLEHPIAGQSEPLGAGYHGRYNAALGLAISAALAVVEPDTPEGSAWLGREATIEWLALPSPDDTLYGHARLTALSDRDALFSIAGRSERGAELLRGQFLLVRVAHGRPIGYPAPAGADRASSLSERARERRRAGPAPTAGLRVRSAPPVLPLGRTAEVVVELTAPPGDGAAWELTARAPAAGGLSLEPSAAPTLTLEPGASETVTFTVRADRPDALNRGEPWVVDFRARCAASEATASVAIAVPDPDLARPLDPLDVRDETTPSLLAWTAPEPCAVDLVRRKLRFPVRLLGKGIRVDVAHPREVTVEAPDILDTSAIAGLTVLQGGRVLGTGTAAVGVTLVDRETPIELEVELTARGRASAEARFAPAGAPRLTERREPGQPDVFRLRPPRPGKVEGSYRVSPDVVRLLLNPVAGHGEPLGRRMHPLSGLGVGASLTAAFDVAEIAPPEPAAPLASALWIRWLALPDLDLDLEARARVESRAEGCRLVRVELFDGAGRRANESEVVIADPAYEGAGAMAAALLARRRIERAGASADRTPSAGPVARFRTRLGGLWQRLSAPGATGDRGTPET